VFYDDQRPVIDRRPGRGLGLRFAVVGFPSTHQCARVVRYEVPLVGETMTAITATDARKSLFGLIQQVNDDHTAVEVVSRHGNAVIMSKDDYDAMTETAYLLRTPANAERLLEAIERARRGEFEQHDLLDA
jgi:antitoxin YefM